MSTLGDVNSIVAMALVWIAVVLSTPLVAFVLFVGFDYIVVDHLVDPSFEFNGKRLLVLMLSVFAFSAICLFSLELVADHFGIGNEIKASPFSALIPGILFVLTRSTVRFLSPRVAREHLGILFLAILISSVVSLAYILCNAVPPWFHTQPFTLPGITAVKTKYFFNWSSLGMAALASIIIPLATDPILAIFGRQRAILMHRRRKNRLIDLTEQLPVKINFISGVTRIKEKIGELIDSQSAELRIITKGYTTILDNRGKIKKRAQNPGSTVMIIGAPLEEISNDRERAEIKDMIEELSKSGVRICEGSYDDVSVVIYGGKRVMVTFSTGGYDMSHVGIFCEHPFVVALFKSYFETKCSNITCSHECHKSLPNP
ncbi:MAG: hypothetical protein ACLP29_04370 [Dissulfurispiraceae bacterium]